MVCGSHRYDWYFYLGVTFVSVPGMVRAGYDLYADGTGFLFWILVIAYVLLPLYYRQFNNHIWVPGSAIRSQGKTGAWFFLISKIVGAAARYIWWPLFFSPLF